MTGIRLTLKTLLILPGILCLADSLSARTYKIMPLGDSITYGVAAYPGYRKFLWNKLTTDGYTVDLVGSVSGTNWAEDQHEGHSGWKTTDLNPKITGWLNTYQPEIVLLHIGSNDIKASPAYEAAAPQNLSNLIDKITAASPNAWVIVAKITPSTWGGNVVAYNNTIPGIVAAKAAQGKRVSMVDMYASVLPSDMADGIHPNAGGYQKMSNVWYPAVKALIEGTTSYNNPPGTPLKPSGETNGVLGTSYIFSSSATDPEGDQIKYGWDWNGDGTVDEWSSIGSSGRTDTRSHVWTTNGSYQMRVKAVDANGNTGSWSNSLQVDIGVPFTVNPSSLDFGAVSYGVKRTGTFTVSPNGGTLTAALTSTNTWITITPSNITTGSVQTITVTADIMKLSRTPGVYTGIVTVTPYAGPAVNIPVSITAQSHPGGNPFPELKVYPNPLKISRDTNLKIEGVPLNSTMKLYTISGRLVKTITDTGSGLNWNVLNARNKPVKRGLYIYVIKDSSGNKQTGKIVVK